MLRGRFGDSSGRPYLEGRLYIPRLGVQGDISFCVDTGADSTVLMPTDGSKMNVDYSALEHPSQTVGVGGVAPVYSERAFLVFSEPSKALYTYELRLSIIPTSVGMKGVPSLLGRDILHRWRMDYHPSTGELLFDVESYDYMVPVD